MKEYLTGDTAPGGLVPDGQETDKSWTGTTMERAIETFFRNFLAPNRREEVMAMTPHEKLESFLADANRFYALAQKNVRLLTAQVQNGAAQPETVRALFHSIHALKGSAALMEGAAPIVQALQTVEAILACQSVEESAKKIQSWLSTVNNALFQAKKILLKFRQQEKELSLLNKSQQFSLESAIRGDQGLMARVCFPGGETLLWFPLSVMLRVVTFSELAGREAICLEGRWVPVIGIREQGEKPMGLGVRLDRGYAVMAVQEVLGTFSWAHAHKQNACSVLDLFQKQRSDFKKAA